MSAALWSSDLGLRSLVIEKSDALGGQLSSIHNPIGNYLGRLADSGEEIRKHFLRSLEAAKFDLAAGRSVLEADLAAKDICTDDGSKFSGSAVIIATGVRRRKLGVEGEEEFLGKGLLTSGAKEVKTVSGKNVVIVGGGDAAVENALILSEYAASITVVHRRNELRARDEFVDRLSDLSNVSVMTGCAIERFEGNKSLQFVVVRDLTNDSIVSVPSDFALVRIGVKPNSELFRSQLEADDDGYLKTDANCLTSMKYVYAVGDVANRSSMTIASAAGNAAGAVSHISKQNSARSANPKI